MWERQAGRASAKQQIKQDEGPRSTPMKEVSMLELIARNFARFAAVSGVVALVVWLSWILLDFEHMNSGFTLPQSVY